MDFYFLLFVISIIIVIVYCLKLYVKSTTVWCKSEKSLMGKTVIVTGANTGIGYATALDLAKRGARIILACRNREKAEEARQKIIDESGNTNVVVKLIDMSSFDSVRKFAKNINETEERLDILINNAAILGMGSNERSSDGHILLMQVNYFSMFLLTSLLIGLMKNNSRIINLTSIMAKTVYNLDVHKLDHDRGAFVDYSISKFCIILFSRELARRSKDLEVTVYSVDPGIADTEICKVAVDWTLVKYLKRWIFKTSEEAAQSVIYCAVAEGIEKYSGENFVNCKKVASIDIAPGLSKKLWDVTEQIVDLKQIS